MSHWAELDDNNVVIRVVVCDNDDPNGDEGYQWLIDNLGGRWVQTSYNNNFRGRFAIVSFMYDDQNDIFYDPTINRLGGRIPNEFIPSTVVFTEGDIDVRS